MLTAKASGVPRRPSGLHASPPGFQGHLPICAALLSQPGIVAGNSPGPGGHVDWVSWQPCSKSVPGVCARRRTGRPCPSAGGGALSPGVGVPDLRRRPLLVGSEVAGSRSLRGGPPAREAVKPGGGSGTPGPGRRGVPDKRLPRLSGLPATRFHSLQ